MKDSRRPIVLMVAGTISYAAALYITTLAVLAFCGMKPDKDVLSALKDVGLVAIGAISSLLARTSSEPAKTEIVNTSENPVPTEPQGNADVTKV